MPVKRDGPTPQWPTLLTSMPAPQSTTNTRRFVPGAVNELELSLEDSPDSYIRKVKQSLQYITDGESYEICLTNRARMSYDGAPLAAYRRMREASPVPYGAYLCFDSFSVLSASPETF